VRNAKGPGPFRLGVETFRIDRPGTHVTASVMGRGPPLLVMPVSWGMDSYVYTRGFSALQGKTRLVFFDPRGVGDSGAAEDPDLPLDVLVEDADAVREHLGLKRWTVLGHSNGGFGALAYVLAHPDRVERLILVCTAASRAFEEEAVQRMRDHAAWPELVQAGDRLRTEGTEEAFRDMMGVMFTMAVRDPERFRRANEDLLGRMRFSPARLRHSSVDLHGYDLRARLNEIRVPTLIIAGKHDLIVPPSASKEIFEGIKASRLIVFPESGHWPFVEERALFVEEVEEFLKDVEVPTETPPEPEEIVTPAEPEAPVAPAEPEVEEPEPESQPVLIESPAVPPQEPVQPIAAREREPSPPKAVVRSPPKRSPPHRPSRLPPKKASRRKEAPPRRVKPAPKKTAPRTGRALKKPTRSPKRSGKHRARRKR